MSTPLRRLRRTHPYLTPSWAGDDDDVLATLLRRPQLDAPPEFGEGYGDVPALRRPPIHDIDRIAALGEANPLPTTESDIPLLSRPVEMPQMQRRPTVIHDGSRPTPIVFGTDDPEQQVMARRRALESYQPQKESKKSLALRTILGFVGGGIPGAAQTLIGPAGVLDRRGKDRAWQQQELGRVDEQYGRMRADRRAGLQDDYLKSQIDENRAQTMRTLREPVAPRRIPPVKQVDEAGNEYLADAETGEPLLDAKGNLRYTGRAKAAPPVKPDTSEFTNEQIARIIGEIEAEQKTLGPSPPTEIADTNQWGDVVGKKTNPAYLDWARRYRELDDQKRQLQMKRKPTAVTRGSQPDTRKGTISKEQQQRWLTDNPNKTLDDMKKLYPNAVMQ